MMLPPPCLTAGTPVLGFQVSPCHRDQVAESLSHLITEPFCRMQLVGPEDQLLFSVKLEGFLFWSRHYHPWIFIKIVDSLNGFDSNDSLLSIFIVSSIKVNE